MMHGDVVTESVLKKIQEFQQRGGLVIADEHLTPAIKPDIRITSYKRTGKADVDKQEFLKKAKELRTALVGKIHSLC